MPPLRKNKQLPRHLLVVRTSAMGDVAMLPHALRALREAHPEVQITVATQAFLRPFFEGLGVDFMALEVNGRHKGVRGTIRLASEAKERGVDAVADMHNVLRSKLVRLTLWLQGLPTKAIDKGRREKRRMIEHGAQTTPLKHTVIRYCDVLRRLGFDFPDPSLSPKEPRPNPMSDKQGIWIGFAPFSAHAGKTYPEALSEEAVRLLADRFERVFIHSGGGAEAAFALRMEALYPNVTALHGKLKLGDEMNLIANLDAVVTMDSLVMHLASLVGTPTVSVWGATHPDLGFLGYSPLPGGGFDRRGVLQLDLPCRPCSVYGKKPCRFGDYRCLHGITPQMILEKVEDVISL